jgi:predicted DNA-binding transcriptional regulator AlpA
VITQSNQLPETGFLRLSQIIGSKTNPPIIPVGKSTWWAGVKSGRYPQSVKHGRMTMWRVEDIREFIKSVGGEQ